MPKKRTDLVGRFGREYVFELASLLLDFGFAIHCQAVGKQSLGQAMAANDATGTLAPARREFHNHGAIPDRRRHRLKRFMARIHEWLVVVGMRRMRRGDHKPHLHHLLNRQTHGQRAVDLHALDFGNLAVLGQHPEFFEHFVKLLLIGHGKSFL